MPMWPSERTNSLVMYANLLLREDEEFSVRVRRVERSMGWKRENKKKLA